MSYVVHHPQELVEGWLEDGGELPCNEACGELASSDPPCFVPSECYGDGSVVGCALLDDLGAGDETSSSSSGKSEDTGTSAGGDPSSTSSGGDVGSSSDGTTSSLDETLRVECQIRWSLDCEGGRGHASLHPLPRPAMGKGVGRWAATMAHAEAASVLSFSALSDELALHGAPDGLIARARDAMHDEVLHAQMMTAIAHRHGARVTPPRFGPIVARSIEAFALENAVEGCVRETWAALEATYQARTAGDPEIRRSMRRIAEDETRHAELAHDIDAWLRAQLSPAAAARVDRARDEAMAALIEQLGGRADGELRRTAGIPSPASARRLAQGLRAALWAC